MKRIVSILILTCLSCLCFAIGCKDAHTEHEYGDWVNVGEHHVRTCTSEGCSESETQAHVYDTVTTVIDGREYYLCTGEGCDAKLEKHEHVYGDWHDNGSTHERECTITDCQEKQVENHNLLGEYGAFVMVENSKKYVKTCSLCGKANSTEVISDSVIEVTPYTASAIFSQIDSNQILFLKSGDYSSYTIQSSISDVIIAGEDNTNIEKIAFLEECSNLKFINLEFDGETKKDGIQMEYGVNGLDIYKCSFLNASQITSKNESYAVKNIKVIDCYFFIDETSVSAMDINILENLTIKGCNFEHVAYNAIQVGHQSIKGNIEITDNVFNYTGSRVLYFVNTEDFTSCNVSDNYFSNNESCDKADGIYIKVGGTETIVLGKNYWRAIPETGYFYFNGSVEYDYYEQETWGN